MDICCKKKIIIRRRNVWSINYKVEGARPRGRPKKTRTEIVPKDCQSHKLNTEDDMDHN